VLQCVAVSYRVAKQTHRPYPEGCCSVLQCVAVRFSLLQCVAVCCSVWQRVAACCSVLPRVAVRCREAKQTHRHDVTVCCRVL